MRPKKLKKHFDEEGLKKQIKASADTNHFRRWQVISSIAFLPQSRSPIVKNMQYYGCLQSFCLVNMPRKIKLITSVVIGRI